MAFATPPQFANISEECEVLIHNQVDTEFEVATAQTIEEAKTVLSAGFEFITEKNGVMLFRKPKRFVNY